jgi:thiamine-phosphate pyrophosphorylase
MSRGSTNDRPGGEGLSARLRLMVITDARVAAPRAIEEVVAEALRAGAPAVQLRDKATEPRHLLEQALRLRALTREWDALLIVNDRMDVALAAQADGVHLGPDDLPVAAVRGAAPAGFIVGFSSDDPAVATAAVHDGADYIGCGTVYPTANKRDAGETIGVAGLDRVAAVVPAPVLGIGGIGVDRAEELAATRATGIAVIGAVMGAPDPAQAVRELLEPFRRRDSQPLDG